MLIGGAQPDEGGEKPQTVQQSSSTGRNIRPKMKTSSFNP